MKLWSRMIKDPFKRSIKKKNQGKNIFIADYSANRRILERSAVAALGYFQSVCGRKFADPSQWRKPLSSNSYEVSGTMTPMMEGDEHNAESGGKECIASYNKCGPMSMNEDEDKSIKNETLGTDVGNSSGEDKLGAVKKLTNSLPQGGNSMTNNFVRNRLDKDKIDGSMDSTFLTGNPNAVRATDEHLPSSGSLNSLQNQILESLGSRSERRNDLSSAKLGSWLVMHHSIPIWPLHLKPGFPSFSRGFRERLLDFLSGNIHRLKSQMNSKLEDLIAEINEGVDDIQPGGIRKMLPVSLDSVYFTGGTLMLLGYGDREPREMNNVIGHLKFQNHYGRVHVHLSGGCKMWRTDANCKESKDGGWLSTDVFVDLIEQNWHANLNISNLFVPVKSHQEGQDIISIVNASNQTSRQRRSLEMILERRLIHVGLALKSKIIKFDMDEKYPMLSL
ncbi:hypothetical protein Scep_008262 [Stephania cephalantha]|uniref:Uncharacterized protein n=1 Tax=Stephania cephalantha TaxID=152367 RepID=A0AAP0KE33_9MAGN